MLIELAGAEVFLEAHQVLHDLHWQLKEGENWAVLGGNGAGKSTFLRLLAGQLWPRPHASRTYHFGSLPTWSPLAAREQMALLSPEVQGRFARLLQDGADNESGWRLTGREAVLAGLRHSDLLHQPPTPAEVEAADRVLHDLDLSELAARPLQRLSQGELRRILLARALVSRPRLLLLDEACSGLDRKARLAMLQLIERVGEAGTVLVTTTHRESEIVPCINRVLRLEAGRIVGREARVHTGRQDPVVAPPRGISAETAKPPLVELDRVSVYLDGTPVLHDLNWRWLPGQHWAVTGSNGAGKSTFLRLLRAELWPAHGGKIRRFDSDAAQPHWEVAQKIALVSPALQARFHQQMPVLDAVGSAFAARLGPGAPLTPEQREASEAVLERCGLGALRGRTFGKLSFGQTRKVLLARALVTRPRILLLDEALDGLDHKSREEWLELLDELAAGGTAILVVSHHEDDWPRVLTHHLHLEHGRIIASP